MLWTTSDIPKSTKYGYCTPRKTIKTKIMKKASA